MVGKHCGVAFAQNPPIEGMCPEIATQIDVIETACYGVRIARGTRRTVIRGDGFRMKQFEGVAETRVKQRLLGREVQFSIHKVLPFTAHAGIVTPAI